MSIESSSPNPSSTEPTPKNVLLTAELDDAGTRLDQFLVQHLAGYSRAALRRLIDSGEVKVSSKLQKPSYRMQADDVVAVNLPEVVKEGPQPEEIPLDFLYEDEYLVVVNKPADMVVHPAKGHWSGTLTSALQFHFNELSQVGGAQRPGIVHRLDRDTTGVIVIAKDDQTHLKLAEQFEQRTTEKEYFAIVAGRMDRDRDWIRQPIGKHPYHREKMAIRENHKTSKPAETFYEVLERYPGFTCVKLLPKTGRTHQLRVHLDCIGNAILCDRLYGGRSQITMKELNSNTTDDQIVLQRQALHAQKLSFTHPTTEERMTVEAPLPADLQRVINCLEQSSSK